MFRRATTSSTFLWDLNTLNPLKLFFQIWTCEGIFWGIQSSWDWNCCICVSSSLCASSRCYRLWAVCRSASRCHRLRESEDGVTDCERPSQSLWVRIDRPSTKSPHTSDFNMRYIKTLSLYSVYLTLSYLFCHIYTSHHNFVNVYLTPCDHTLTHVWLPHTITLHMYSIHCIPFMFLTFLEQFLIAWIWNI